MITLKKPKCCLNMILPAKRESGASTTGLIGPVIQ